MQLKNTELSTRIKEMEATIQEAQRLHQTTDQVVEKKAAAEQKLETMTKELSDAITENNRHISDGGTLSTLHARELELEGRLGDMEEKFQQMKADLGL